MSTPTNTFWRLARTASSSLNAGIIYRQLSTSKTRHIIRPIPVGTYKDKYGRIIQRRVRLSRSTPSKATTISSSLSSIRQSVSPYSVSSDMPRFNLLTATHLHVRFPGGIYLQIPRQLPKIPVAGPAIVPLPLKTSIAPAPVADGVSITPTASSALTGTSATSSTLAPSISIIAGHPSTTAVTSSSLSSSKISSTVNQQAKAIAQPIFTWFQENIPTIILNMGSLATLTAFTRSDILELRMLSITGSLSSIIYFSTRPPPRIYAPMIWSSIFVLTNTYMLYKIYMERQGSFGTNKISMEELYAYQEFFAPYGVTPRQFGYLLSKATKRFYAKDSVVLHQHEICDKVFLVLSGKTEARVVKSMTKTPVTSTAVTTPSTPAALTTTHTNTATNISRRITAAGSVIGNKKSLVGGDAGAWIGEEVFLEDWSTRTSLPPTLPKKLVRKLKEEKANVDMEDTNTSSSNNDSTYNLSNPKIHTSLLEYCAVEDTVMLEWTHDDLIELLSQGSSDLRTAVPRAMTGAVIGKVVNMYSSSSSSSSSSA